MENLHLIMERTNGLDSIYYDFEKSRVYFIDNCGRVTATLKQSYNEVIQILASLNKK